MSASLILSFDCSPRGVGVCLYDTDSSRTLYVQCDPIVRGQDGRLVPFICAALRSTHVQWRDIDRIVVPRGPGSFTSLRIALAAAQGLSLANDIPLVAINRFDLYEHALKIQHKDKELSSCLIVLESQRAELFVRITGENPCMHPPAALAGDSVDWSQDHVIGGDVAMERLPALLHAHYHPTGIPECILLAEYARNLPSDNPDNPPVPYYVRPPDVTHKNG